jgi:hypothetical protein
MRVVLDTGNFNPCRRRVDTVKLYCDQNEVKFIQQSETSLAFSSLLEVCYRSINRFVSTVLGAFQKSFKAFSYEPNRA